MNTNSQAPVISVTGGSRGVGAATARLAAARGYDVALSFVSDESAARAVAADVEAAGRRALPVRADNADPEQVIRLFAAVDRAFGRIDVLVNNAAMLARQLRMEELGFERMQCIFAVNAIGPMLCAQQAVKRMSHRHGGRGGVIVNVSSASARLGSPNEYVDYAASKGAVERRGSETALFGLHRRACKLVGVCSCWSKFWAHRGKVSWWRSWCGA